MATQSNVSMVSEVSICNQALLWLAQDPIVSLNQATATAGWMLNNYPFIRDAVIESRMWTFAMVKAISTTANLDGWGTLYAHATPLGWIRVLRAYDDPSCAETQDQASWALEGDKIISDSAKLYLYGVERVVDTAKFSPSFVQALAARIAADACIPLTENRNLQADLWNLYEKKLSEAAAIDGQQGKNQKLKSGNLTRVRGRSTKIGPIV